MRIFLALNVSLSEEKLTHLLCNDFPCFTPRKEWVNKVNLSSFELENFFKFVQAKQLDATTMFTYSHANTPLGQSERAYYLSYFIKGKCRCST